MRNGIAILSSLILHGILFLLLSISARPSDNSIAFRKGEIAMELLPAQSVTSLAESDGDEKISTEPQKQKHGTSGVVSGSELGIVSPEYPESSRLKGEEGDVIVAFDLDSENKFVQAQIEKSSGFPKLDEAALKAIQSNYPPSSDKKTTKHQRVRMVFKLSQ